MKVLWSIFKLYFKWKLASFTETFKMAEQQDQYEHFWQGKENLVTLLIV